MRLKSAVFGTIYAVLLAVLTLAGLKIVDEYLRRTRPAFLVNPADLGGPVDPRRPGVPVTSFTYYPYSAGHTQPNFAIEGGKVRSGDHGFNIDFDLDRPPAKPRGEYRIVLIGGSAAWGWGASASEKTMARVIESAIASSLPCKGRSSARVINLAMNGSVSYANFVALNQWGHALAPDAIISFSGNNDSWLPPYPYFYNMSLLNGMIATTYPVNTPAALRPISEFFPGIFEHTPLGYVVRSIYVADHEQAAFNEYRGRFISKAEQAADPWSGIVPQYVHALRSIKRDFGGIPMMVAYQPFMSRPGNRGRNPMSDAEITEYLARYEKFIERSADSLRGYLNDRWLIFDGHRFYAEKLLAAHHPGDGVHLDDPQQRLFGDEIARQLRPWICG